MALTRSIGAYDDGTALVPGVGTTPLDTRKSLSALWASAGVVAGGPSPLVTGTSGFAYSVAGPVPFVTSRGPSDGFHMFTNDGAQNVPITNAAGVTLAGPPGSGLQRIDILWVQHRTNSENSDLTSAPRFGVESGTAVSSSPVAPSLPTGALELARNTMTSAATSTASAGNVIAQTAVFAVQRIVPKVATFGLETSIWDPDLTRITKLSRTAGRWLLSASLKNKGAGVFGAGWTPFGNLPAEALSPSQAGLSCAGAYTPGDGTWSAVTVDINLTTGAIQFYIPATVTAAVSTLAVRFSASWDA